MSDLPQIDLAHTAFVAIDLQNNILAAKTIGPSTPDQVLEVNNQLAERLENTAALIVQVTVNVHSVQTLFPFKESDQNGSTTPNTAQLMMPIAHDPFAKNVLIINKQNPGAFFGTDLDLQLRRRGIDTIILTGVSSSNGVYATAFDAYQQHYRLITVSDACADRDPESHQFFFSKIFPRVGWVTDSETLLANLPD